MERIDANSLDLKDKVIYINRVAKVVKGGKRFSFTAIVAVGDSDGHVGVGLGKAKEVPLAIRKAIDKAKKDLFSVPISNGTIGHGVLGKYGAGRVMLKPAAAGTGIIAGGAVRAVLESVGIHDILTKTIGTTNPHNVVKATVNALMQIKNVEELAALRRGRGAI